MSYRRWRHAFTLVEILVALFFMTIALGAYIALSARLAYTDEKIIRRTENISLVQTELITDMANGGTPEPGLPGGLKFSSAVNKWIDDTGPHAVEAGTYLRDPNLWW